MFIFYQAITDNHFQLFFFFFFNDTATTEIYTLSLHDALPILCARGNYIYPPVPTMRLTTDLFAYCHERIRSEEHTSELQSLAYLVCRLLLEKKNKNITQNFNYKKQKQQHK